MNWEDVDGGGVGGSGGGEGCRSGVDVVADVVVVVVQQLLTTASRSQSGGFSMDEMRRERIKKEEGMKEWRQEKALTFGRVGR